MTENKYQSIIENYLTGNLNVEQFIDKFMDQWTDDRDNNIKNDERFQRLIDRIFTSCDCYEHPIPELKFTEKQLKDEVDLLRHIWFG